MASYKLSKEAENYLIIIHQYGVINHGEVKADKYYFALFERFEKIAEQPYLYQSVDNIRQGYRHSICGVDAIYYRIEEDIVEIMNVIGKQDIDGLR